VPDLGDGVNLDHRVYNRAGTLTAATVVVAVARPDGTAITAPEVTTPSTGYYQAATFVPDVSGTWTFTWSVSGTVTDVQHGSFTVTTPTDYVPLGGPYATLAQLKAQMGIADNVTARDAELTRRLISASTDINSWTHRQFGKALTATTRKFRVGASGIDTHDFWTDDDLAITPYLGQTAGTAWDVSTLELEPTDGIVNQVPGWPYNRITMSGYGSHPLWLASNWGGYTAWVTAKWGWAAVPANVVTSCIMLAVADDKAKDAPFGVAGFGDFAVRIRANPMVEEKLKDYVLGGNLLVAS
jgi:hypothetical protein